MAGLLEALAARRAAREIENRIHVSRRYRYVYVAVPKAACSTLKRRLGRIEAEAAGADPAALSRHVHDRAASPLLAPSDLAPGEFEALMAGGAFRFAFVRNPFARALSAFLDKILRNRKQKAAWLRGAGLDPLRDRDREVGFRAFLEGIAAAPPGHRSDPHWAPMAELLAPDLVTYDMIGRLERFEQDWNRLCRAVFRGEGRRKLRENRDGHATGAAEKLARYYGPAETALARAIYAADFAAFGYDPESPHAPPPG